MAEAFDLPGGPAFPISIPGVGDNGCHGMSLLDYFAAKAMHAEINTAGQHKGAALALASAARAAGQTIEERIAFNAYGVAKAMIATRAALSTGGRDE